jgi:hypothetical protein
MAKHPTLFSSPIKTLYYFSIVLAHYAKDSINWMIKNWIYVSISSLPFILPRIIKSPVKKIYCFNKNILLNLKNKNIVFGIS